MKDGRTGWIVVVRSRDSNDKVTSTSQVFRTEDEAKIHAFRLINSDAYVHLETVPLTSEV